MNTLLFVIPFFSSTITLTLSRAITNNYEIRDLFSVLPDFSNAANSWLSFSFTPKYFICDNLPYFGGQQLLWPGRSIERTYSTLLSHNVVYVSAMISITGTWEQNDGIVMTAWFGNDVTSIFDWSHTANLSYGPCDVNDVHIKGRVFHQGSSLTLKFESRSLNYNGYFGIRDIHLRPAYETPALEDVCVISEYYMASSIGTGNKCGCRINQYQPPLSTCQDCHPSCEGCNGPLASDCFACKFGYYYDGTQCVKCSPTCINCETCQFCSGNDYYMDDVCVTKCDLPFLKVISSDYRLCLSPCSRTQVIYADGTCRSTCIFPFIYPPATDYTRQVCQSPCSVGQVLLPDGSCVPGPCQYPRFIKLYSGSMGVCEYPCPTYPSQIFYKHNSSCMPTCNFPFVKKIYGAYSACEPPCLVNYYYRYWEGTCQPGCLSLLQKRSVEGVLLCDPPQCGALLCDLCGSGNTCRQYYYCNTTNGKFCFPYYKHSLDIELISSFINGVKLSVKVVPVIDITSADELLELSVANMHLNSDYQSKITQVGKGSFQVEIVLLQPVNSITAKAFFVYAPHTLLIKSDYTLTGLTFINQGIRGASEDSKKGSQIAFMVFIVTTVGMVLSGGLTSLWTSMPESQYTYYLIYLNIDFLHHTEVYLESLSNYDILVNSPDNDEPLDTSFNRFLPRKFYLRNYSPDFVANCGQLALQTVVSLSVLGLSALLIKYGRFSGRGMLILKGLVFIRDTLRWDLIIRQLMTYALPVLIAAFVQIYSNIFGKDIYWLSLILALITVLAFAIFFVKTFNLISKIPRSRYHLVIYSRRFGTLWEDIDTTKKTRYYYWFVTLRASLLAYVAVFCSVMPFLQIIILIIYQVFIVSLFINGFSLRRVFYDKTLNKVTFLEEACLLLVKLLMLLFLSMVETAGDKLLILIGWAIVLPAVAAQATQIFYSIYAQLSDCSRFVKLYHLGKSLIRGKQTKKITKFKRKIQRIRFRE